MPRNWPTPRAATPTRRSWPRPAPAPASGRPSRRRLSSGSACIRYDRRRVGIPGGGRDRRMSRVRRRTWVWHFDRPPEDIWPLMADTARFNEAAALPKHEIEEIPQADGSVLYLGRLKRGPLTLEWQEKPVNWVHAQWFEHCREFRNGPFKSLCAIFELGGEGTGSRGAYTLAVEPANALGLAILAGGFFAKSARTFGKLAAEANEFALGRREEPF